MGKREVSSRPRHFFRASSLESGNKNMNGIGRERQLSRSDWRINERNNRENGREKVLTMSSEKFDRNSA